MTHHTNPFIRGYRDLSIRRLLMITHEDDCPPTYRPLHSSQTQLSDAQVQLFPCIFCDSFALVTEGQQIADELSRQCPGNGIVRTVLYEITANDFGTPLHVGDTYSTEAATNLVHRLTFETGHFSRCWEINSGHITEDAMHYLQDLVHTGAPDDLLFEPFTVPASCAVGCKLICTPWTDSHLDKVDGRNSGQLRQAQQRSGVPHSLVDLLHLAALADTRILIFDPDAPVLSGLPLCDED